MIVPIGASLATLHVENAWVFLKNLRIPAFFFDGNISPISDGGSESSEELEELMLGVVVDGNSWGGVEVEG